MQCSRLQVIEDTIEGEDVAIEQIFAISTDCGSKLRSAEVGVSGDRLTSYNVVVVWSRIQRLRIIKGRVSSIDFGMERISSFGCLIKRFVLSITSTVLQMRGYYCAERACCIARLVTITAVSITLHDILRRVSSKSVKEVDHPITFAAPTMPEAFVKPSRILRVSAFWSTSGIHLSSKCK